MGNKAAAERRCARASVHPQVAASTSAASSVADHCTNNRTTRTAAADGHIHKTADGAAVRTVDIASESVEGDDILALMLAGTRSRVGRTLSTPSPPRPTAALAAICVPRLAAKDIAAMPAAMSTRATDAQWAPVGPSINTPSTKKVRICDVVDEAPLADRDPTMRRKRPLSGPSVTSPYAKRVTMKMTKIIDSTTSKSTVGEIQALKKTNTQLKDDNARLRQRNRELESQVAEYEKYCGLLV